MLSDTDLERLRRNLDYLDAAEKRRVLDLLEEREKEQQLAAARTRFIEYVKRMWPDVVLGAHHTLMAEAYERIVFGKSKRLIINIAPRHSKSEMTSWLLPTWFLGHNPKAKIMQCMNTQDLASGFGRRVRNVISREAIATEKKGLDPYHDVFPELDLAKDSGAAYHWHTSVGGEYYAVGTGGKIAGRGADLLIIDDPHALYTSTLLPTPEGFIAIGDIEVGDEVFGPDGKPTKVIAVSEVWSDRPLYEVIAPDGSKILCDAAHLWTYRSDTKLSAPFRTESAERIVARQLANNPILPTVAPVEYPEQSLPIDPYVLGYWLGNGTAEVARITSHPDDTLWVREQFEAAGYATSDLKDERSFGVLGLWSLLRTMDLLGRKRVPPSYMVASPRQRMALLQGLMDSDGTVSKAGQCSFDNTDRALVEAVQQLVLSFGVRTGAIQRIEPTRTGFVTENPTYRVTFQMQDAARIPRKRDRLRHATRRGRSITIRKTDQRGPVRCITVEREDGLFLAGEGYIVTHNSEQEAKLAISNPEVFDQVYEWYVYGPRQRLQPNGKIILVQCVAEGERVLMADGQWRPIEQVLVGDKVIGYEAGRPVPKTVTATVPQGEDDIVEVVSRSCALRVNRKHPFLVMRGGSPKSPTTQEDVIKARDWRLEWVPAGDLQPKDVVVTIKAMDRKTGSRPMAFVGGDRAGTQMTQDDYWLIGFMFGDGWLATSQARGHVGVCIALSDKPDLNAEVLDKATRCWGARFAPTPYGYIRSDNKALASWLAGLGFSSGAKTKRLPPWVFRLRPADKRAFLTGFFRADGWLRIAKHVDTWQVGLANKELLDDLRLLARTCGVKTTKLYTYVSTIQAPNSPKPIEANHFSARFSFKQDRVEMSGRFRGMDQQTLGRHFRLEEIDEVRPAGKANVYDITVEGAESFVAEGFVVHNTRWSKRDLTGRLLQKMAEDDSVVADKWEQIEFPAILDENTPSERALWPAYWPLETQQATRAALPVSAWQSQYQQNPVSGQSAIFKREYWRIWGEDKTEDVEAGRATCPGPRHAGAWQNLEPPACEYILHSWDTAIKKNQRADFSAFTSWGVFKAEDPTTGLEVNHIIMLSAWKARLEFPELKKKVREFYDEDRPDTLLIEDKGSGSSLIQELRSMGIAVENFSYGRGQRGVSNDKIARANTISDVFASRYVWRPARRWAEEVETELSDFPGGAHDDYVDSTVQAMIRFRAGNLVATANDVEEEDEPRRFMRKRYY